MRAEWTRKAAEAGRVWCSVSKGGGGPMQRRYRSRPAIKGLAYGERGREAGDFIAEVARKGWSAHQRSGCCQGVGQATGAVLSWARKRIGRLALWESAMAIEMAHGIAPGNQTAVPEKAAEVAPGVWNV